MSKKIKKTKGKQDTIEKRRQLQALKSMYFNRYLMVRYFLAVFFFTNFYWALYTQGRWIMVLPILLLIISILPCYENMKSYGEPSYIMKWTKRYYTLQSLVCGSCTLLVCTPLYKEVLPFLQDSNAIRLFMFIILSLATIMAYGCVRRLTKIEVKEDKQYIRIQQYEKALKQQV